MRGLSRVLVSLTVGASLIAAPLSVAAAPAVEVSPDGAVDEPPDELPLDTDAPPLDTDELPLETDAPPLDTDTDEAPDELPLDTDDEPPLDTDELPLDTDELPLDTDAEPPPPQLEDEFDTDEGAAIDDGYDPTRDSPEAQTARRWLRAGIAATVTGAVLVGGATALGMTDRCDPLAGNNCFADARDRAAVTMGVPGGVLLLGGLAMTVLGGLQKRRLARGITASVTGSREQVGVFVFGRF